MVEAGAVPVSRVVSPSAPVSGGVLRRVPAAYARDAHHWLILLGRYVCQARKPRCWECVVAPYCDYRPKTPPP